jgi:hypothetical protein
MQTPAITLALRTVTHTSRGSNVSAAASSLSTLSTTELQQSAEGPNILALAPRTQRFDLLPLPTLGPAAAAAHSSSNNPLADMLLQQQQQKTGSEGGPISDGAPGSEGGLQAAGRQALAGMRVLAYLDVLVYACMDVHVHV